MSIRTWQRSQVIHIVFNILTEKDTGKVQSAEINTNVEDEKVTFTFPDIIKVKLTSLSQYEEQYLKTDEDARYGSSFSDGRKAKNSLFFLKIVL